MKHYQWMILYAILLHWVWGSVLMSSTAPLQVTAISTIIKIGLVSAPAAGLFYLLVAVTAMIGLFVHKKYSIFFLLPQSAVLWLGAYGAWKAMTLGMFADGVIRSHEFLITDQAPAVIAAIFHTAAVLNKFFSE